MGSKEELEEKPGAFISFTSLGCMNSMCLEEGMGNVFRGHSGEFIL